MRSNSVSRVRHAVSNTEDGLPVGPEARKVRGRGTVEEREREIMTTDRLIFNTFPPPSFFSE